VRKELRPLDIAAENFKISNGNVPLTAETLAVFYSLILATVYFKKNT
jgi:hypothetical protein